ncbi:hypothetical protein ACIA5G_52435 [Amycolatopsis sp. NPDC051758]|uniref:hypothetical protein n=1 Tax=Amycolatopsis sp. NPDC051758 TaxID=3363935 RepID=UPI00379BB68F
MSVPFVGDDGRSRAWPVGTLPLPGWHAPIAEALAARTGPAGGLRTRESANNAWIAAARLLRFLASLPEPPTDPPALTAGHLHQYRLHRRAAASSAVVTSELAELRRLLRHLPDPVSVPAAAWDVLAVRTRGTTHRSLPGYSDGEFRRLVAAARADVAAVADRIDRGEHIMQAWRTAPEDLQQQDRALGAALAEITDTGVVPTQAGSAGVPWQEAQRALAGNLFVTRADLPALLVLMVAVSARNIETVKELPAEHQLVGDRALGLQLVKRRRGAQGWLDSVNWEIGPSHRRLHTPGGLYLLLHRLMKRGRGFTGNDTLWSIWASHTRSTTDGPQIRNPFARRLGSAVPFTQWAAKHGLLVDAADPDDVPRPLPVDLRRVRTSAEVRRTRAVGGHLPSAARSNTVPVLFSHYLRGDPTTTDWAEEVIGDAVADAETAALTAHRRALEHTGAATLAVDPAGSPGRSATEGPWSACRDPEHRPDTGRACRPITMLACFHCSNCLITEAHLPAITALTAALNRRRTTLSEQDWWDRYGTTWAAIQHDVLPRFTPAQVARAQHGPPAETMLDLAEAPWEWS